MDKRMDFRQLAQTLQAQGIDPVTELARVLQWQVPQLKAGQPVVDDEGRLVMTYAVDPETRTRILATLVALSEMAANCDGEDQTPIEMGETDDSRGTPT